MSAGSDRATTLPIEQEQLDEWAAMAEVFRTRPFDIALMVARQEYDQARRALIDLHMQGAYLTTTLREAGAVPPGPLNLSSPAPEVPLHLLDTPANRRLLRALEDAFEAAQDVDRERGHHDPDEAEDGPAALPVVELLAKVQLEVWGPAGKE